MLEKIEIYREKDGDRNCPHCKATDDKIVVGFPRLAHNRTELKLECYCPECGCNFIFTYTLFVSDIEITN
jgi:rubredoxin